MTKRLGDLSKKTEALATDQDIFNRNTRDPLKRVFDALCGLMTLPDPPKRPVGLIDPEDKGSKTASKARLKT